MPTDPKVLADARSYHEKHAEALGLPVWSDAPATVTADQDAGKLAGLAFENLGHAPHDPAVKESYDALKRETLAQHDHAVANGVKFTPWTQPGQPYSSSADMIRDVTTNRHLWYFPTKAGFGTAGDDRFADHPLNAEVPGMPGTKYNDLFRAIHDYYAHAQHGHQFGPTGELRAWVEHARMFSPLARRALTTETHGQNSWVNFGPHEPWRLKQTERPFADQKAGILPDEAHPKVKLARPEDLLPWLKEIRGGGKFDHNASKAYADLLQERGDWRSHLFARPASYKWKYVMNDNAANAHTYTSHDGTPVEYLERFGRGDKVEEHDPYSMHLVKFAPSGHVAITTFHGNENTFSVHTPEEYEALRADAAAAGVHFPAPPSRPTKLSRVSEDVRVYRKQVRPRFVNHVKFNTADEHVLMHDFFVKRGLKVKKGTYAYYDPAAHTFHHPTPEDKAAVAQSYLNWTETPVHLERHGTDEQSFLDAIEKDPKDHTAKLVYADWLQEHGADEPAEKLRTWAKLHAHLDEVGPDRRLTESPRVQPWVRQLLLVHRLRHGIAEHQHAGAAWPKVLLPSLASVERSALGVERGDASAIHDSNVRALANRDGAYNDATDEHPWATLTMAAHHLSNSVQFPQERHHLDYAEDWAGMHAPVFHRAAKDHLYHGEGGGPTKLSRADIAAHEKGVAANPKDATGWLSLADHYEEQGLPGAEHLRLHAAQLGTHPILSHDNRDRLIKSLYTNEGWTDKSTSLRSLIPDRVAPYTAPRFSGGAPLAGVAGAMLPPLHERSFFPERIRTFYLSTGHPVHVAVDPAATHLARWRQENTAWWLDHKGNMIPLPADTTHGEYLLKRLDKLEPVLPGLTAANADHAEDRDGEYHDLVRHAFKFGWHRVMHSGATLLVHSDEAKHLNAAQRNGVKDHALTVGAKSALHFGADGQERPIRLARVPGTGAGVRAEQTDTHATRLGIARQILAEAGVRAQVRSVQAHTDARGVRPGVSVAIGEAVPHALARYLGAWLGLMTGERKVTVFHPGEGEDVLHVIDSPFEQAHVGEYLKKSGVPAFTLEKRGSGTRAYVVNPMNLVDVETAARGVGASSHQQIPGAAVRLGDASSDADARAGFRQVISDAEGGAPEQPVKLAAIQPASSAQPTVTVKLPQAPAPAAATVAPEQPAKPRPAKASGPAFIFPG